MLLVSFLAMLVGLALLWAGVHGGDAWRRPWAPFVRAFRKGGELAPAGE